ncbi:MAG: tRNA lysidine(34) synthetase TilS, partial [Planctomycetes bacterium]|nr:tRNA lysidine(34) synthetase TilS [Planctomycetota bacterium]
MSPHALQQEILEQWPPATWCDVTVLVAVSGGPDSVALLRALLSVARPGTGRLIITHFNHGLRGSESESDEQFVRQLGERLGLQCEVGRAAAADPGLRSVSEASAREARYAFFRDAAARLGARYIATGHTADDQAETVLHRAIRGTGIAGLAGIRRHREILHGISLIRPLLGVRRSDVWSFLASIGQQCRHDSSNGNQDFTRNRIRLDLIPRIESQYNANVVSALTRLASLADEVQSWLDLQVDQLIPAIAALGGGQVAVDCRALSHVRRLLVRELFVAIWKQQ